MSVLDDLLKAHRKRLIEREEATFREMLAVYRELQADLQKQYKEIERAIAEAAAEGVEVSRSWALRSRRLRSLLAQVEEQIVRFGGRVTARVAAEQRAAIQIAANHAREAINVISPGTPIQLGSTLSPRTIESAVGMMGDGSPMLAYFEKTLAPAVAEKLRSEIIKAVATGTDFNTIARRLRQAGDITRSRALMMARTEVNRVRRATTLEIYRDNEDVIEGWEWVAAKSPRTCPACLAMDGRIFKLKDAFPQHINCRCTLIPVIKGVPRSKRTLGPDWLAKQSAEVQDQILGKEAGEAYRRGEVDLRDFVGWATDRNFGKQVYTKSLASALLKKVYDDIGPTQNTTVQYYDESARAVLHELLGRKRISDKNVATMAGALDGSLVQVETDGRAVRFHVHHPDVRTQIRTLSRDSEGALYFYNNEFFKEDGAPGGLGTIAFARQAFQASELGIEYIKTEAIGNYGSAKSNEANGYYTWARLGYNAQFSPEGSRYFESLLDKKRKIRDINDLMKTEDGREAWRRYGGTTYMVFELDGRSKSMRTLRRYILEKRGII